ncbi:DUF305 domain-containing protein [Streptomyces triticagri]|uniref:DUF305 domain-containing protein n=1 Tax=Streptomyces triticagri TaxID=2293568 RepID=A0A372M0C6_9ACTN|nr:DUF305 domain-containing protein [Streptomyces triticagri]RFU84070.1 DUF305 domain-containing protein [Streptomyces triticagri]
MRVLAAAATAAVALSVTACDSGGDDNSAAQSGPSVIAPGKPGERAETIGPEEAKKRRGDDSPNSADVTYAQMMIVHHKQALTMTKLAPKRAKASKVKRLAKRIEAAQGPEVGAMEGWLAKHDKAASGKGEGGGDGEAHGGSGHDHAKMPGMAGEAQLESLRKAEGEAFDQLFLKLMITHHRGAVMMATDVLSDGNNVQLEEMATDVIAQQTSEINRMRGMA